MLRVESFRQILIRLKPYATTIMLVAIFFAISQYLARNWSVVTQHQWRISWPWLLLAIFTVMVFWVSVANGWRNIVVLNGVSVTRLNGLWIWSRSSLARYLPTPIWETGSRIYLTVQLGASWQSATISYGAGLIGQLAGAFSIALIALPIFIKMSLIVSIVLTLIIIFIVLPFAYLVLYRLFKCTNFLPQYSLITFVGLSCLYAVAFIMYGLAHVFVLHSLVNTIPSINLVIGVSAFAWALGTLNIFTPSGVGTREMVLIYGLQNFVDPPELFALSVITRLLTLLVELFIFGIVYLLAVSGYCDKQMHSI